MRQFSLPPEWKPGESCVLEGGRARYLARVLRLAPGDSFPGLDSEGRRWLCELRESGPERLLIEVRPYPPGYVEPGHLEDIRGGRAEPSRRGAAAETSRGAEGTEPGTAAALGPAAAPLPPICLVQGLPKGAKMDLVVRQAAEAGVARIIPLQARRSAVAADSAARLERWRRIAREGLQQSGSTVPTRVEAPIELAALPAALGEPRPGKLRLLLDAEAGPGGTGFAPGELGAHSAADHAKTEFAPGELGAHSAAGAVGAPLAQASLHGYLTQTPDEIVLCVGPEGGFAAEERRALAQAGFSPLKLPCAVLRTETAALYAVAAVEIVLAERFSWIPRAR